MTWTHTSHATLHKEAVAYSHNGDILEGYLVYDSALTDKKTLPGILIVPDWMGLSPKSDSRDRAEKLAALGYVAFAADIYGKGKLPKDPAEAGALAGRYKGDRPLLRARTQAGLDKLKSFKFVDSQKLVAIGYCFGGTSVLELARSGAELKAVATFHGGLDTPKPEDAKNIKAKIVAYHGADDPFVPEAQVQAFEEEMRKAKVDWQLVSYGGAVHSFSNPAAGSDNSKGAAYNASADSRSWTAFQAFLKETL